MRYEKNTFKKFEDKKRTKTKTETPRFQHVFTGYKLHVQKVHSYSDYRHREYNSQSYRDEGSEN